MHSEMGAFFLLLSECFCILDKKSVMNDFVKECFDGYIISKIEEIHAQKSGKIEPDYVLYVELINSITSDVKSVLNKFYKEKRYVIGKTLNDKYIKDKKWESK